MGKLFRVASDCREREGARPKNDCVAARPGGHFSLAAQARLRGPRLTSHRGIEGRAALAFWFECRKICAATAPARISLIRSRVFRQRLLCRSTISAAAMSVRLQGSLRYDFNTSAASCTPISLAVSNTQRPAAPKVDKAAPTLGLSPDFAATSADATAPIARASMNLLCRKSVKTVY